MVMILCEGMSAQEAVTTALNEYILKKESEEVGFNLESFCGNYIVRLAPLYEWENPQDAFPENEFVSVEMDGTWVWESDWDEGQSKVALYGVTPLDKVTPYWEVTRWTK